MHRSSLLNQLLRHWPMKLWLGTLLCLLFYGGYVFLNYHPLRPPTQLTPSAIDRAIHFSPDWTWAYLSLYLMLPLAWLAETREQLARYALGMGLIMLIGFGCFILYPVSGPRPAIVPPHRMYVWLISYDRPLNSFPSLHLALATYSGGVGLQFSHGKLRRFLMLLLPAWVMLIAYATLATKQHYAIDLIPGVLLGGIARQIAWWIGRNRAISQPHPSVAEGMV